MARIVAVDDELEWLGVCQEGLTEAGHLVTAIGNAEEAYEVLQSHRPDVVILDIAMPVSGRTLLRMLQDLSPPVPVIIYSAYAGYRDDPDFSQAEGFVVKSTDVSELNRTVQSVLDGTNGGMEGGPG